MCIQAGESTVSAKTYSCQDFAHFRAAPPSRKEAAGRVCACNREGGVQPCEGVSLLCTLARPLQENAGLQLWLKYE